jgi:hypothetical protein
MARETTYAGVLGELVRLNASLAANAAELPHLEGTLGRLDKLVTEAAQSAQRQAALIASKQEESKRQATLLIEASRVASAVRKLLMEHYGLRAEKLAEFGLQPFRGRRRRQAEPETPEAPIPAPPVPASAAADDSKE